MTLTQLEERLSALEKRFEQLETRLAEKNGQEAPREQTPSPPTEDELIPGVEYPFVTSVPPKEVLHLKGVIVSVSEGRKGSGALGRRVGQSGTGAR